MINRICHGWTTTKNAEKYKNVLFETVFPEIEAKNIPGFREIELLRSNKGGEVEFVTIMTFNYIQNVIDFQG
jgi:heme-degrading monooxygenase HmoA